MSRKIFKTIWIVAFVVFIASFLFIMGISYDYFTGIQKDQLKIETSLAAYGVEASGADYFEGLDTDEYRVTWIDSDGTVLYDSDANADTMENHLGREEVREALETGYGEGSRMSSTIAEEQYYAAQKLSDGTVIRISVDQMTIWSVMLGFAPQICAVIIIALVVSLILASRLAKKIVEPLNKIDLDNPGEYLGKENFKEVEPLLIRISKQQEQLKGDKAEIENASLIRQEFTANVSHELKTPLHAISGYAELLENGMVKNSDIKPFAAKIRSESVRMTNLVEDIIDLTRLDNGGGDVNWEECDLCRIAENAIDSLNSTASEKGVELKKDLQPASMRGVPQHLYSIVYNLCDNGIKYNHDGGTVRVKIRNNADGILLSVKDTGIGIPKESQNRIFERFFRVDKSRSQDVGGTGLGLSIVKHAVIIHKGTIMVNSSHGKGAEFTVIFPK